MGNVRSSIYLRTLVLNAMAIRLLAVDMDGTFLDDNKCYDRLRFLRQYEQLAMRGIYFVAASGNQYATLCRYLPELVGRAAFVAENGALVVDCGKVIFRAAIDRLNLEPVFAALPRFSHLLSIVCTEDKCYCHRQMSSEGAAFLTPYYRNQIRVPDYACIEDPIVKLAFYIPPQEMDTFIATITPLLGSSLRLVVSGNGFLDLLRSDVNKAVGLGYLQRQWQVADQEIAAFGDNDNDMEMLQRTPFSFAPVTASVRARERAAFIIGSNNDGGVLDIIDDILAGVYDEQFG